MEPLAHCRAALAYAEQVASGEQRASKWVRLACQRQLNDLERWQDQPGAPYWFDWAAAERVCRFIEGFGHVKGEWARHGARIQLEPWQSAVLTTAFGWRRRDTGARRYKIVYLEVARKNAKSTLASGVGLYMLAADQEPGAVVVSAATTRDQARLCFQDAQQLARREANFRRLFHVTVRAHAITQERTASTFYALSAEGSHQDGLNISAAIIDELHAHKTRAIWDVIETATGARRSPLIWAITTAGSNQAGICYEQRGYLQKILEGAVEDDSYYGAIYTLDEGDQWEDPQNWIKANPNLGVSIYRDDLERQAKKANETPAALANFLTKRMNVWVAADTAWMDARHWMRAARPGLQLENFRYEACYIGLDLASKSDVTAVCLWFPPAGDRQEHALFFRYYLAEQSLQREENARLAELVRAGQASGRPCVIVQPGAVTDYEALADDLERLAATLNVREMAADPWQLPPLLSILNRRSFDLPIVETRQIVQTMSPAMKETEALLLAGRLIHDANPVSAWMFGNVVCHRDNKENYYPKRANKGAKIDGIIALLTAQDRLLRAYGTARAYDTRTEFLTAPFFADAAYHAGPFDPLADV